MKSLSLAIILSLALTLLTTEAHAQDRGFGIGAQVTSPAGLSFKGWISETGALASVVGFTVSENNSSFYAHLDYLHHNSYDELVWDVGYLTYYYGGGARFIWREAGFDDTFFALRLPAGLNFNFTEIPVDFYVELAPTFEVSPDFSFGFTGGLGFRYFLN